MANPAGATAAGSIEIGGDLVVRRLAFGAMRITGRGIWGEPPPAVAEAAGRHGASPRQIVLAWLLARSPRMLPIPGTGSPEHAEANVAAAAIELSPDEVAAITQAA